MFHVEHMKNSCFYLILALFAALSLSSCKKKDPNPEKLDPIYSDLMQEMDLFDKQLIEKEKELEGARKELAAAVPQTGTTIPLRNKVFMSENSVDAIKQRKKYFQIKIEQRRSEVQKRYLESFIKGGRPWPDEEEIKQYRIRMKLQRDALAWDKKDVPRGTDRKEAPKAEHGEAPPPVH